MRHGNAPASNLQSALQWLRSLDAGARGADASPRPSQREDSPGVGADCHQRRSLETFAESQGLLISYAWLDSLIPLAGGHEHETYADEKLPGWRIKLTGPGLSLLTGRRRFPHVTEANYLESWSYANWVFGDEVEFLGVIPTDEGSRLVICQPEVEATDPDNPHPTKPQICAWLRSAGFEYDEGAWLREADGIYLSDEHEGNFITTPEGLRPIDVHLRRLTWATGPVIPWADNPAHPLRLG